MTPDRPPTPPQWGSAFLPARAPVRLLLIALLACLSGCSTLGSYRGPAPEAAVVREAPPVEPAVTVESETVAETGPATGAAIRQPIIKVAPPQPGRILVLRSSDAASYQDVAITLGSALADRYELEQANLADAGTVGRLIDRTPGHWTAAVAIGADAAEFIGNELDVPAVFCQIFDYQPLLARHGLLFGVEAQPPLELQLASWKRLAADASSVGVIVGTNDTELAESARRAAASLGIELRTIVADSDREALYQFKRIAQSVDAIWLLPNSDILSPRALREILDYALDHDVHSIVFNKTLLDWGALLSVTGDTDDVTAAVSRVLDALAGGNLAGVERITPLTTVETTINRLAAEELGIAATRVIAIQGLLSARSGGT